MEGCLYPKGPKVFFNTSLGVDWGGFNLRVSRTFLGGLWTLRDSAFLKWLFDGFIRFCCSVFGCLFLFLWLNLMVL